METTPCESKYELARTALLARFYVTERAVSLAVAAIVQLLTSRADVAVALW